MSTSLPSDEVAADFKDSLQDLQINNRYEISNLTIIAKENTEHAMGISKVLENHIKTTPPPRKLPALYVLDSIVKNVGTPYTIYLGRNLFNTFMEAYRLVVDPQTRKSMEAMLKTWKEPVPGSMDTRPVFPVDITRAIETALIKWRTATVQQQQQNRTQRPLHSLPSRPNAVDPAQWRNTPTPPNAYGYVPPPGTNGYNAQGGSGFMPLNFAPQQPQAFMQHQFTPNESQIYQHATNSMPYTQAETDTLNADLSRLIIEAREEFASNIYEPSIQLKLKALLDLQTILSNQQLPLDQRQLIKDQVAQLSAASQRSNVSAQQQTPGMLQDLSHILKSTQSHQPVPQGISTIPTTNLAQLLASVPQQSSTPVPATHTNGIAGAPAAPLELPQGLVEPENPLIASLRAAGILPTPTNSPRPGSAKPEIKQEAFLQLPGSTIAPALPRSPLQEIHNDVQLTPASLKLPRPQLIASLYQALPNQCTTCGRRFLATEEGKQRKARHLDWHFSTNQRMQDANRRAQNRSYYVGEWEWIKYREPDNADELLGTQGEEGTSALDNGGSVSGKKDTQAPYIKAPNDPSIVNQTCPICQEKFEAVWLDAAQDWVWLDAIKVGDRIYHASCHAEVNKGQAQFTVRGSTPDPTVLGKRKADDEASLHHRSMKKQSA